MTHDHHHLDQVLHDTHHSHHLIHHHGEEDEDEEPREISILYATETGNAQDVAERLARLCRRLHFQVQLASLDEYEADSLFSAHTAIFVVSTTGSGREPRSMTAFWQSLLRADLPSDLFDHLAFAVFGLGDTAYEKFCWAAKLLERRLLSLGATQLVERGDADDQHHLGIDGALDPWIKKLTKDLLTAFPLPPGLEVIPDGKPPPRVAITELNGRNSKGPVETVEETESGCFASTVARNVRITSQDWYQDVRHLEFDFDQDITYEPGDIAVIHPVVPAPDVDSFLINMGWANIADEVFTVSHILMEQSLPPRMPRTVTLRLLFSRYLDINAVPRKGFFALLRYFSTDEMESDKLDEFLIGEHAADDLYDYCTSVRRTIREVLEEFRSVKIPKEYLFDLFPVLRPREFSIASSIRCHPKQVHLCVAIVNYRTRLRIPRRGVATTYLAGLQPGDKVEMLIKKGFFTVPTDNNTPVICVGPGTGIAPARAIVEERAALGTRDNILYQGCRSATKDQHYKDEFFAFASPEPSKESLTIPVVSLAKSSIGNGNAKSDGVAPHESGTKLTYRVACSRDGPPGVKRTYVQDLILEDGEKVWEVIGRKNGYVYISGSSNKMPAGIRAALRDIVVKYGGETEGDAKEFVNRMEREGRLVEDCWA
ncbi:riboflavin synthase domain-like protein [Irpex rosettiformis]|uniref:Riboflavin synthase domain-like protein n=1 Tax=Irpex rosettiformis TaxID=378272 RepID=A0ACB8U039_9APHY|nr:riboflavin synthase domain-like protein [Irpex rosettiformis]